MRTFLCMTTLACCLMFTQSGYAQANKAEQNVPATGQKAPAPAAAKPAPDGQGAMYKDQNYRGNVNVDQNYRGNVNVDQNYRGNVDQNYRGQEYRGQVNQNYQGQAHAANAGCPQDHPCEDQPCGECWCLMCHYEPRCYTTQRCVEEQIPCTKKCWRKVPQCYEVQKCKMVPEYYTETCTKYVDECYEVPDCKTVKKMVCDEHVEYCPTYYWKHICENPECPQKCAK